MEDSDRSTDGFNLEDLRERVDRRKLLLGLGITVLGGGAILDTQSDSTQKEDTNEIAQAEAQLVDLADQVDNTNLDNPREASSLHNKVTQVVKSVTDFSINTTQVDQKPSNDSPLLMSR